MELIEVREERFIIKIVEMFYKQGMSQTSIAKTLNISKASVSRTIALAKKRGYIEFKIHYPDDSMSSMEECLEKKYGLKEVIIGPSDQPEQLAQYASDFLLRTIKDSMKITITWGDSIRNTIEIMANDPRVKFLNYNNLLVIPSLGSTNVALNAPKGVRMAYSNYVVEEFARVLNARSYQMLCPLYVTKEAKKILLEQDSIKEMFSLCRNVDMAIVGIGMVSRKSKLLKLNKEYQKFYPAVKERGGVGEVLGHVIDKNGNTVWQDYEDQLISLGLDDLKKIPIRLGIAYGKNKRKAVKAAIESGYVNVLITDNEIAEYLLK